MSERERVRTDATGAIADPRAYLQQRVVIYTRALFWILVAMAVFMNAMFALVGPPAENFYSRPITWIIFGVPPLLVGGAWRLVARGAPSAALLRLADVVATAVPCVMLLVVVPQQGVDAVNGTVGLIHVTVTVGCLLIIRAAAVPGKPLGTWLVTTVLMAPIVPMAHTHWASPHTMPGMSVGETGALTFAVIVLFVSATAAIVARMVHRLEATARKAMQLGQYTLGERIGEGGMGVVYEMCGHHLHTEPKPPSERLGTPIDSDLQDAILACLEKDPADRPASAASLVSSLRACQAASAWTAQTARKWWTDHAAAIAEHRARAVTPEMASPLATVMVAR